MSRAGTKRKAEDGLPPPVRPLEWMTLVRDHPDRPPPVQRLVLDCLALRLDWEDRGKHVPGHGFASVAQLARDADCRASTVKRATTWARGHGLLIRLTRGHHVTGGTAAISEWRLRRPRQRAPVDTLTDESQLAPADTLADSQLAPAAPPKSQQGTDNRDLVTGNSRPRLNGSLEGGLDGQGDDDDLKTYQPDPGDVLAALGVDASEAEFIITRLEAGGVGDPAAYLLGISAKGDGEVRDFLDWIRTRP